MAQISALLLMFFLYRVNPLSTKASCISMRMKQTAKTKTNSLTPSYKPRSDNQKQYVSHLINPNVPIVFGIGPAGCGKTLFACTTAIEALKKNTIQKIIITRPIVPVEEEEIGFLPGTLVKKMDPWTRPLMDIFLEYYKQHELDFMISSGIIEISPLAYMRGRTFKRAFIIADEMQNSSPNQMLMLTTRIGEDSKMVITGDLKQSDRCENNGLLDFMKKYKSYVEKHEDSEIKMVEMTHSDIERSPVVSKILSIYGDGKEYVPPDLSKLPKHVPPKLNITYEFFTPSPVQSNTTNSAQSNESYVPPDLSKLPRHSLFAYIIDNNSTASNNVNQITSDAALIPLSSEPRGIYRKPPSSAMNFDL